MQFQKQIQKTRRTQEKKQQLQAIKPEAAARLARDQDRREQTERKYYPNSTEARALQEVGHILSSRIEVHEKEWTGGRNRKQSLVRTQVFGGRIPVEIVNAINRLKPRSKTYHLERALRLYVLVLEYVDWSDSNNGESAGPNPKKTRVLRKRRAPISQ